MPVSALFLPDMKEFTIPVPHGEEVSGAQLSFEYKCMKMEGFIPEKVNRGSQNCTSESFSDAVLILPTGLDAVMRGWTKFINSALRV